jgi:CRP/FNR family transcriptional regulator, cyclic AMP receptor protein
MSAATRPDRHLAHIPLFAEVADDALAKLARQSLIRRYPRGQILCSEGDPGDGLIVLTDGQVRIGRYTRDGQEVVLAVVDAPAAFGELALIDGAPRSATITATQDVGVCLIGRAAFLALVEREPPVAMALLRTLAGMVRATNERLTDQVALDIPGRLAKWLLARIAQPESIAAVDAVVSLPISQRELAAELGATRVSVNRALKGFEAEGAITVERDRIVVHRADLLSGHAG